MIIQLHVCVKLTENLEEKYKDFYVVLPFTADDRKEM